MSHLLVIDVQCIGGVLLILLSRLLKIPKDVSKATVDARFGYLDL